MLKRIVNKQGGGSPSVEFYFAKIFEPLIVLMIFLLANRRAWYCFLVLDSTDYYCEYGNSSTDFTWWGVIIIGVVLLLAQKHLMKDFVNRWKANWAFLIFIMYSGLSLLWTVDLNRSVHTLYILIGASISAAGLATMYSREQLFRLLLWFAGLTALGSLVAVVLFPKAAITQVFYLAGTWRGVFSHKNYLGSVMAFGNALFLLNFWQERNHYIRAGLSAAFYLLTLFLVIMSQSATGLIVLILLNGLVLVYFAWLKWGKLLRRTHHIWLVALLSLVAGAVLLNFRSLFSLIGRRPTLTGRVPLWQYLFRDVISHRPWFGYGWETLWYQRAFQVASAKASGWGIIIVNSHSGYMDILVYLGVFGLVSFLLVIIQGLIRVVHSALNTASSDSFLPLLILAYVLIANTTISYFIEFESFHWVLLVLVLFMTASSPKLMQAQEASET